jgi:hypothetical protein
MHNEKTIIFKNEIEIERSGRNWNGRVSCNSASSLIKLIELDVVLKEKLKGYKWEFEQN